MRHLNIKFALMSVLSVITVSIVVLVISSFSGIASVYSGAEYIGGTLAKRQMTVCIHRDRICLPSSDGDEFRDVENRQGSDEDEPGKLPGTEGKIE